MTAVLSLTIEKDKNMIMWDVIWHTLRALHTAQPAHLSQHNVSQHSQSLKAINSHILDTRT